MCPLVVVLRDRKGLTILEKVKGHSEVEGNKEADCLANEEAIKNTQDEIDL